MTTALPPSTDYTSAAATQGNKKTFVATMRTFVAALLGADGLRQTALAALKAHSAQTLTNIEISPTAASNVLTVAIKTDAGADPSADDPVMIGLRSATAGSGAFALKALSAALSQTVSAGSTLGLAAGVPTWVYVYLIDSDGAGTWKIGLTATFMGRATIGSTVAEGGIGAADSATVIYSDAVYANKAMRCAGRMQFTLATPGNWAAPGAVELEPFDLQQPIGRQSIWVPAGAMVSRTTAGAAAGSLETTTNKVMLKTLDFDPATAEYAQFSVRMPRSWDEGTIQAQFLWSHAATTTNFTVRWGIQGVAMSDTDAQDAAFGTAITVDDVGGTTNALYQSAETAAVTIGGSPAENDLVVFQVYRDATAGADTLAIDARLQGVMVFFNTNAVNDA